MLVERIVGCAFGPALPHLTREQTGRGAGALEEEAHLQEEPPLVASQAGVHGGIEERGSLCHGLKVFMRSIGPSCAARRIVQRQVQAVDPLPHAAADVLPHLARILAGRGDARGDRIDVRQIGKRVAICVAVHP